MSTVSSDRRTRNFGVALFLVAFAIRLIGINWGLPNDLRNSSLHPDETVVYSNYAYQPNPLLPGNYNYPSFYPTMLRVVGDIAATYGGYDSILGERPPNSMEEQKMMLTKHASHLRAVNLAGRVISSLAGAGLAVVVFLLLAQALGLRAALLGGTLAAIAPALVVHSRFQTVDVTAAFFLWLSLLFAMRLAQSDEKAVRNALLSGLFAGLGSGTKYTGIVALLAVVAAIWIGRRKNWLSIGGIAFGACVAAFLISTPGVVLQTNEFLNGLSLEARHMREGHELTFVATPPAWVYHIGNLFTGLGPLAFAIGCGGFLLAAVRKRLWALVLLPPLAAYYIAIGGSEVKFLRYSLPLMPALCCGFGYAAAALTRRGSLGMALAGASIVGLDSLLVSGVKPLHETFDQRFGGLYGTARYTVYMLREDPRDEAARYIKRLPDATVGLFQIPWFWTVPVIKDSDLLYNLPPEQLGFALQTYFATTSNPRVTFASVEPPPGYVAVTSLEYAPFERIRSESEVPALWKPMYDGLRPIYQRIRADYEVDRSFGSDAPAVEDLHVIQPKAEVLRHR